jgi:hypothetical protein
MDTEVQLLDVVALTEDLTDHGLVRGQVGTVVESLDSNVFEIEFCDNSGKIYAMLALNSAQLMVLYHQPAQVS